MNCDLGIDWKIPPKTLRQRCNTPVINNFYRYLHKFKVILARVFIQIYTVTTTRLFKSPDHDKLSILYIF